jgi:glycosyltransferase involved in cell wall biosynthesis
VKILHLATHEGVYRGGAVQLCRMARAQKLLGHQVDVIANLAGGESPDRIDQLYSSWAALDTPEGSLRQMTYRTLAGLMRLRSMIKREKYDIMHAHRDIALLAMMRACWGLRRPQLVAQRGTIKPPPTKVARAMSSKRLGAVVTVADDVKRVLVKVAQIKPQKVHTVYGSVDLGTFAPQSPKVSLHTKLGLSEETRIIGSLSAWRKAKGFSLFIEALGNVFQSHSKVHAVFLGRGVEKNVGPVAEKYGISERCHFIGHRSDVAEWLSIMDFTVVAAYDREGLSGVLRESLAMEVSVISTDCAGNGEIVNDRRTGLLIPMNDAGALSAAMNWALDHPGEMKTMARAGRQWVIEHCSMEVQANHLLKIYQGLLDAS